VACLIQAGWSLEQGEDSLHDSLLGSCLANSSPRVRLSHSAQTWERLVLSSMHRIIVVRTWARQAGLEHSRRMSLGSMGPRTTYNRYATGLCQLLPSSRWDRVIVIDIQAAAHFISFV
jgi:hypothetical protein